MVIPSSNSKVYADIMVRVLKNILVMQAESAADQMDWIEKITGVITSLLSSQSPERVNISKMLDL